MHCWPAAEVSRRHSAAPTREDRQPGQVKVTLASSAMVHTRQRQVPLAVDVATPPTKVLGMEMRLWVCSRRSVMDLDR